MIPLFMNPSWCKRDNAPAISSMAGTNSLQHAFLRRPFARVGSDRGKAKDRFL